MSFRVWGLGALNLSGGYGFRNATDPRQELKIRLEDAEEPVWGLGFRGLGFYWV